MSKEINEIQNLIAKFEKGLDHYKRKSYNETQLRNEFLDPLFEELGWDIKNKLGQSTGEREVIVEEPLKNESLENTKKPDYTFRLFNERKFFLEAKKPSVNIESSNEVAYQTRRYGWSANLKISVASNFEYLLIFDCTDKPKDSDNYSKSLIAKYHYKEFIEKFQEIKSILGKESVYNGEFDEYWSRIEDSVTKTRVDDQFLSDINRWRRKLGSEIFKLDQEITEDHLNDSVQSYINALIFLRVCEDRHIEEYKSLLNTVDKDNFQKLVQKLKKADKRYNSGLFELDLSEPIIETINSVFWDILQELYHPNSLYSFSVMSSDILGNIYEIFLSERLVINNGNVDLEKKPDHIDRDVVTTPTYIIREILRRTLIPKLKETTIEDIDKLKVSDIACGSGAFLLEAYQVLQDYLVDYYLKEDTSKVVGCGVNTYKLPFVEKKKLLINNIWGIDIDFNAVQACKFGLLLKLLENEDSESLDGGNAILPKLDKTIKCGNSLVNFKDVNDNMESNPLNIEDRFDVIVGNPPYMKTEDMKNLLGEELSIYKKKYSSAYKQFDKYYLFVERGLELLNENGVLGYITPSKFTKIGSGKNLRKLLAEKEVVDEFVSFGANQIFENRTTYTCLLIVRDNSQKADLKYYEVRDLDKWKTRQYEENSKNEINKEDLSDSNWILLPNDLEDIHNKIWKKSSKLVDIVGAENIFNGIQTSANDVYVIDTWEENSGVIEFEKGGSIFKLEKELTRKFYLQKNSDQTLNTYIETVPNKLIFYPYKIDEDHDVQFINYNELKEKYPYSFQFVSHFKERLEKRDISPAPSTSNEWYRYGRHQSLNKFLDETKIIVGILSKGDKYAIDKSNTFIASGGTAGYCAIRNSPDSQYSIYYIQALLNSKYAEWTAMNIGDVFRGGYFAHGTAVLKRLPIRSINFASEERELHNNIASLQESLIDLGTKISNTKDKRDIDSLEKEFGYKKKVLGELLRNLYGLSIQDDNKIPLINNYNETD